MSKVESSACVVNTQIGQADMGPGLVSMVPGRVDTGLGRVVTVPGQVDMEPGQAVTGLGRVVTVPGRVVTVPGQVVMGLGRVVTVPGQVVTEPGQVMMVPGRVTVPGRVPSLIRALQDLPPVERKIKVRSIGLATGLISMDDQLHLQPI
jgi:hypothetical protein